MSTYEGVIGQIVRHHAELRQGLEERAGALRRAAENGIPPQRQLRSLQEYLAGEILPHAQAEERTLYPAADVQAHRGDLVRDLTAEHRELAHLAGRLQAGLEGAEAAAVSEQIATLFAGHVVKENDLLLPALAGSGADLAALLADMRQSQTGARPR